MVALLLRQDVVLVLNDKVDVFGKVFIESVELRRHLGRDLQVLGEEVLHVLIGRASVVHITLAILISTGIIVIILSHVILYVLVLAGVVRVLVIVNVLTIIIHNLLRMTVNRVTLASRLITATRSFHTVPCATALIVLLINRGVVPLVLLTTLQFLVNTSSFFGIRLSLSTHLLALVLLVLLVLSELLLRATYAFLQLLLRLILHPLKLLLLGLGQMNMTSSTIV